VGDPAGLAILIMSPTPQPSRRVGFFLLTTALAWFGTMSIFGQQPQQQAPTAPTVRSIEVEYSGPATVSKERILAQLRTAIGQPYSDQVVEQDIRQLYAMGAIRNVRIFAQPDGEGVKVIVAVQTRSVVREIEIDGAKKISARRLRKDVSIKINSPVNEEELEKGRQKIIETYQGRGFTDINVQYRVDAIEEQRGTARIVYVVDEGTKGAVKQVRFEGNTKFTDGVLRKQMKTRGKTLLAIVDKSGRLDEAQLQRDLDSIKEYYQNHGYIDVEVRDVRKEREKGPLVITIAINEGIQYHVGRMAFNGYKVTTEEKLRKLLKMKEGDVYSPTQLHDDAKAIADAYGTGGYVDLLVVPTGSPVGEGRIDVQYKIEEGNRSFVQRINIVGNTRTKDKVIRREVLIAPGDVFNTVRVDTSKKRLENLGYFSKVETYPEETGVPGRKDLVVQVEEKRTGSLSFGGGFSTIDQLVVFGELTQGNFDLMNWPGFTGAGQKFRLRAQVGTQRKDFILAVTEPYFLDRRLSLSGQAFYNEANYLSAVYDQRNLGFSTELRKPLFPFTWGSIGYRLENVEIFDVAGDATPDIVAEEGSTLKSTVLGSIVFDRRDNPLLTRTGERVAFSPYISGGFLGGDVQIYGWDLEGSKYYHLPKDLILLFNAEMAVVDVWNTPSTRSITVSVRKRDPDTNEPIEDPDNPGLFLMVPAERQIPNVPIFDRLYLGGSNNLRGFSFRDIGPRDRHGEPLGGQTLARATVELTFPIVEKARGAVFYDVGVVNADAYDFGINTITVTHFTSGKATENYDNIGSDVGVGLRLDLPIGPLRVDYGFPIQTDGRSSNGHFNFNVGYQF
jgi:outer membrane protein insertion porin family